jgi:hypothetical protein
MMTITWTVTSMTAYPQHEGETDVVFSVAWCCTATDGTFTNAVPGSIGVTWQAGTPFTPYDQLTEDQVLGWVFAGLGSEKATVEGYAVKGVEEQANPPVVTPPLPWAPPPVEIVPDAPPAPEPTPAPAPVEEPV